MNIVIDEGVAVLEVLAFADPVLQLLELLAAVLQVVHQVAGLFFDKVLLTDEAIEAATERLEAEARRRAMEGVERGVYYKGRRVATEREYSDGLLSFLLKGLKPEKYSSTTTPCLYKFSVRGRLSDFQVTNSKMPVQM